MPRQSTKTRKRKSDAGIARAIGVMTEAYGPFPEEPRLDAAHEIVFTILSQHTSDIISSRAYKLLMDRFGALENVAQGDLADIEQAISPGGLARIKAPRIKEVLNRLLDSTNPWTQGKPKPSSEKNTRLLVILHGQRYRRV